MADSGRKGFESFQEKSVKKKSLEYRVGKVSECRGIARGTTVVKAKSATKSNAKFKCCQCQANRRCLRCQCVQNGRSCVDCYPSRNSPSTCANLPSGQSSAGQSSAKELSTRKVCSRESCSKGSSLSSASAARSRTADPEDSSVEDTVQTFSSSILALPGLSVQRLSSPLVNEQQPSPQVEASPVVGQLSPVQAPTIQETRTENTQLSSTEDSDHGVFAEATNSLDSDARWEASSLELFSPSGTLLQCTQSQCAQSQPVELEDDPDRPGASEPETQQLFSPTPSAVYRDSLQISQTPRMFWNFLSAYDEIVHWRKRFFEVPNNSIGKAFVSELAQLLQTFVNSRGAEKDTLYGFMILPALLLQKPTDKCSYKDAGQHLRRRLDLWERKDLQALMEEGECLQQQYRPKFQGGRFQGEEDAARRFGNSMATGRVHEALRMLMDNGASGVLQMEETITIKDGVTATVAELLAEKHPSSQPAHPSVLLEGECPRVNNIRFEALTPALVQKVAKQCRGSAGPSGLDSDAWRRLCLSFKGPSSAMCNALAGFARLLATQTLDDESLVPFLSCRLIALDKRPGVRPIGVCEVIRRIIAKAILRVVGHDVEEACGYLQKCSGCPAGLQAAVHAVQQMYGQQETEGLLLVDATNAFNSLNRRAALHYVRYLCPALSTCLHNCYNTPSMLFVSRGGELASQEGTTQGDPLSMPFYALATLPLIKVLQKQHPSVRQAWLADDSAGAGRLKELRKWWDTLCDAGRSYGYFTNCGKTILLVREDLVSAAKDLFVDTGVQINSTGVRYLGSAVGNESFATTYLAQRVEEWLDELKVLATFARTEPHAAYAALTHGLGSKYTFLMQTLPDTNKVLHKIDKFLVEELLPALSNRKGFTDDELSLLRLPARLGGIGLPSLTGMADSELAASQAMTKAQVEEIVQQNLPHKAASIEQMHQSAIRARNQAKEYRRKTEKIQLQKLMSHSSLESRQLELLSAKGTSAWLTTLPLKSHGFWLGKRDFWDALALRYNWALENVPVTCVCGAPFSLDHALVCSFGGYPTIRHNELRDLIGKLLSEVCHNVAIEPTLASLSGEKLQRRSTNTAPEARLDVRARGFWSRQEDAFFDVRVFHPGASSYKSTSPNDLFQRHERLKQLEYEERITNVDHGSFCPLVFATTGAAGPLCARFLKRLAALMTIEDPASYSATMAWIRAKVSFALQRNAIMCIRGSRSAHGRALRATEREICIAESRLLVDAR